MDRGAFVRMLAGRWWFILVSLFVFILATYAFSIRMTPTYRTITTLIVNPDTSLDMSSSLLGLDTLSRQEGILETYNSVSTSKTIINSAASKIDMPQEELKQYKVTGEVVRGANIVAITVDGPNPVRLTALTNNIASETISYAQTLYEAYTIKTLDPAAIPELPISPNIPLNLALAGGLGLVVGFALAFVSVYLRSSADSVLDQDVLDPITGLYNRTYFMQKLKQKLAQGNSRQDYSLSVGLMQIQNLDIVRESYPERASNEVLREVANCMKQQIRPEDSVARVSWNQFAFLFPDTQGYAAKGRVEDIQLQIERRPFRVDSIASKLNLSSVSGVTERQLDDNPNEMMIRVEKALQHAEIHSYRRVHLWEEIVEPA